MSIHLAYAPFERPLVAPFRYGNKSLSVRRGFVLRKNNALYSEASPLPGHSMDDFAEVGRILSTRSAAELQDPESRPSLPPSLRFALEGFTAQESPGIFPVRTNALLRNTTVEDARAQLGAMGRAGYRVCKCKLAADNWESIVDLVDEFSPFRFRLDTNLAFDPPRLESLLTALETRSLLARVEYIEEPFPGIWDMAAFHGSPVPLAADESAANPGLALRLLARVNPPSVFVVKPTVAGGLLSLEGFLRDLKAAGKKFVFTSAIESEAGRRSLLAFLSRQPRDVSGISTGYLFRENFLEDRAEWTAVPPVGAAEQKYLATLPWKECP